MESRTIERDRWETMLRWIAVGLALATLALAAACGQDDAVAERVEASTEVIRVAAAPPLPVASSPVLEAPASYLARQPEETPVTYGQAEAVFREGRHAEAVDLFVRYVEREPTDPRGHYMLGISAWKDGYLDTAEAHLTESMLIDPNHVRARVNLARVLIELGRPSVAAQHALVAEELAPDDVAAKRTLARALAEAGDHEGALDKYDEALWVGPEDRWSLNNMGYLMIQRGDHEDAVGPLALAVRLDSANATFRNNLGSALEGAGLGRGVETDSLAQAYLEELRGCVGESADTVAHRGRRG